MTLVEVVVSLAISGLVLGGMICGYIFSVTLAERSALSLAANTRAVERLEQTRAAKWDTASYPTVDELVTTNFPNSVVVLQSSGTRSGITYGTNQVEISQISVNPPLKRIRVDCIWRFNGSQPITNTVETCRAPSQ
jgi:hypothetical protein